MRVLLVEPAKSSIPSDGNMVHVDTALSVYAQQRRDFDEITAPTVRYPAGPTVGRGLTLRRIAPTWAFDKQTRKRNRMAS